MNFSIEELEQAATVVAMTWDPSARKLAEEKLMAFKKAKEPYDLCKAILDRSTNECLLFEAARTLGEAVARDWKTLISQEGGQGRIESVLTSLIEWAVMKGPRVSAYVRESTLRSGAAIVKRSCVGDVGNSLICKLMGDAEKLMNSGDVTQQIVAVSLLTSMLLEMSLSTNCCRMGMTWEAHCLVRRRFEEEEMPKMFVVLVGLTEQMVNYPGDLSDSTVSELIGKVLTALELVFSWDFLPKRIPRRYIGRFKNSEKTPLRPNEKWKSFFRDDSLIQLFFKLHFRVRQYSHMGIKSSLCLVQLASLDGVVMEDRERYFLDYLTVMLAYVEPMEPIDYEYPILAEILSNLNLVYRLHTALGTPAAMETMLGLRFLNCHANILLKCIEGASLELLVTAEDSVCCETIDNLFANWTNLFGYISASTSTSEARKGNNWLMVPGLLETVRVLNARIFECFVRSHLAAPEGFRNRTPDGLVIMESDNSEIDLDCEDPDRDVYGELLLSVGMCGRAVASESIPYITRMLHERTGLLLTTPQAATWLLEDIHWLLLTAGHLLTEADLALVPSALTRHSLSQASVGDVEAAKTLLVACASGPPAGPDWPGREAVVDDIVRLISALLRLLRTVSGRMDSPEIAADIFWVMTKVATSYFAINESDYHEVSSTLLALFSGNTNACLSACISGLLEACRTGLETWAGETEVTQTIAKLLVAMTMQKDSAHLVTSCEHWWSLAEGVCHLRAPFDVSPAPVVHSLIQAVVQATKALLRTDREQHYLLMTLEPIQSRVDKLLQVNMKCIKENSKALSHWEEQVSLGIMLLQGVAMGAPLAGSDDIYAMLIPRLELAYQFVATVALNPEVMSSILELLCVVGERCLSFLKADQAAQLYQVTMRLIYAYAEKNLNKRTLEVNAEEDQFDDVKLFLTFLNHLLQKDYVNFDFDEPENPQTPTAAEIVVFALNYLIPLMKEDMLMIPDLCDLYYKLLNGVCELTPAKVWELPQHVIKTLFECLEMGLYKYNTEVAKVCLEAVFSLAENVVQSLTDTAQVKEERGSCLVPFLSRLIGLFTQGEAFDLEVTDVASATVLALICCNKDSYRSSVTSWVSSLPQDQAMRLYSAFDALTPDLEHLSISRQDRLAFIERFEKFVVEARAFLCVF